MAETLATMERFGALIAGIESGAQTQLEDISQVAGAVLDMEGITQQNVAMVEHLADASQRLQEQAREVAAALSVFRLESGAASALPDAVALRRAAKQGQQSPQQQPAAG